MTMIVILCEMILFSKYEYLNKSFLRWYYLCEMILLSAHHTDEYEDYPIRDDSIECL